MLSKTLSHPDAYDIREAIREELEDTPEFLEFVIEDRIQDGQLWTISVDMTQTLRTEGLDESLEGAAAWWPGPPKGGADVLAVIPENQQLTLRFATSSPPVKGKKIRIYPPRYLEALLHCWENNAWATQCLTWLVQLHQANTFTPNRALAKHSFPWLRAAQAAAFKLPGWKVGFLWGPPGTGKTTTLGALLAEYLVTFPTARILLLSTTNSAVDIALVAVDKRLEELSRQVSTATQVRKDCCRVGNHFIASQYKEREHLLPVKDERLIRLLADLEATRPDKEDVQAYARWKQQVEGVRLQIRQQAARVLQEKRLAAMTTTRAVFTFAELSALPPYDLVVFDEASQVGLAHALAVAPLAKFALFAGDPRQLSPIVRSRRRLAKRWLGNSMFVYMQEDDASTCLLNEQSRMAAPICDLVSNLFYKGKLVVAQDCINNLQWAQARVLFAVPPLNVNDKPLCLQMVEKNGTWSHKYHGPIRYVSAEFIQHVVSSLTLKVKPEDILVLTPFRAQRALIRTLLRKAGSKSVLVSTVHRAQGSERHTVIFDPVQGDTQFMQDENARRLINVALSRAQARLVIILSPADRKNPLFDQIYNIVENQNVIQEIVPIEQLVSRPNFPSDTIGLPVRIDSATGRVIDVDTRSDRFILHDLQTGKTRKYVTSGLIKQYRSPLPTPVDQKQGTHIPQKRSDFANMEENVRLREKALNIIENSRAFWTPTERAFLGQQFGTTGDSTLAKKLLVHVQFGEGPGTAASPSSKVKEIRLREKALQIIQNSKISWTPAERSFLSQQFGITGDRTLARKLLKSPLH